MPALDTQEPDSPTLSKQALFHLGKNMLGYALLPSVILQYYQHHHTNQHDASLTMPENVAKMIHI